MPIYRYLDFKPEIGSKCFVAPTAEVIGRVQIGDESNLWFQTVTRGDVNEIKIGKNTNIQDLSMLHVTEENPLIIGDNVTVGHNVILHACTIEDSCLIGMGAIVLDGAVIGEGSLVAAGSVVPPGKKYPPKSMILGSPAVVKRPLRDEELNEYNNHYKTYLVTKNEYIDPKLFERID